MRHAMVWMVVIGMVLVFSGAVSAQQALIDSGCQGLRQGAQDVLQGRDAGEGRGLACLYAFEDKLSAQCEYALYDAAAQLERVINALAYAANECRDDLTKYCADIKPGQGRLLQCIDKNDAKVSSRCKQALKVTGLKK